MYKRLPLFLFIIAVFYACASVGNPSGGDYDEAPPKFLGGDPVPNALHVSKNKIVLQFDEFLALEKPAEKVIITPPQKKMPVIKAVGKRITVELKDSLIPNTTYTFDFTNAIVDNNEKNALEGFSYAFSTGDVVDSLVISGVLLNAEDLEPMPNIMVGIHSDLSDTAFTRLPFLRTSQTNETGRFWIRNIAPGTYRLFALNDANRDFKFDQAAEAIAFYDSLIVPSFEPTLRQDTLWKDSLNIDTIHEIRYTRFTPDDILLRLFQEPFERQYLTKNERTNAYQFVFTFNAPVAELPNITLENALDFENPFLIEQSPDRKILTYWLTDSLVYQQDTLFIAAEYCAHDNDNEYITKNDTIRLITKKIQKPEKENKKNKEETVKRDALEIRVTPSGAMEVFDTLRITFSEPPIDFPMKTIQFQQKVDTLWENRPLLLLRDSLNPRVFWVDQTWKYEEEYQIKIDSAAIYSIYGRWNDSIQTSVKIKSEKEYGNIFVAVVGNETAGFGQILDSSGKVAGWASLENGELAFYDLKPGKYYLCYIEDWNGNQRWDTGLYTEKLQPEPVYYYPGFFELKAYMEFENETPWDLKALPWDKQKPLEITKNKPKEKQAKKREQQNENKNVRTGSNRNAINPAGGAVPGGSGGISRRQNF